MTWSAVHGTGPAQIPSGHPTSRVTHSRLGKGHDGVVRLAAPVQANWQSRQHRLSWQIPGAHDDPLEQLRQQEGHRAGLARQRRQAGGHEGTDRRMQRMIFSRPSESFKCQARPSPDGPDSQGPQRRTHNIHICMYVYIYILYTNPENVLVKSHGGLS